MARTTPSSASLGRVTNVISWELMKCKDTLLGFTDYKKASVNFSPCDIKVNPERMLNDVSARAAPKNLDLQYLAWPMHFILHTKYFNIFDIAI